MDYSKYDLYPESKPKPQRGCREAVFLAVLVTGTKILLSVFPGRSVFIVAATFLAALIILSISLGVASSIRTRLKYGGKPITTLDIQGKPFKDVAKEPDPPPPS
jgi:hypothetical protein